MSFLKTLVVLSRWIFGWYCIVISFLGGKNTRCTYTPDARVVNDFSKKEWVFSTPTTMTASDRRSVFKRR